MIIERLKVATNRQKSYANMRRKDSVFESIALEEGNDISEKGQVEP